MADSNTVLADAALAYGEHDPLAAARTLAKVSRDAFYKAKLIPPVDRYTDCYINDNEELAPQFQPEIQAVPARFVDNGPAAGSLPSEC